MKFIMRTSLLGTLLFTFFFSTARADETKCVNIYYDQIPDEKPTYTLGRHYVIFLQNLLGHFPHIQQYISPINVYKKGDIDKCAATIYIGTNNETPNENIPKSFYEDFVASKRNVLWVKNNIQNLGDPNLQKIWDIKYDKIYLADEKERDTNDLPGFYKYFTYKGEVFTKYGAYEKSKTEFMAEDEIVGLKLINKEAEKNVVSWAINSANKSKIPYILHKGNHWYVADNPFSYIYENDRYLIFADILFDVLDEKPQDGGKKYALVRFEDVSTKNFTRNITTIADMFAKLKTPFALSLIPIYADPLQVYNRGQYVELTRRRWTVDAVKHAVKQGASILMHGLTHQYSNVKNPYSGVTGEDYEFWDHVNNRPLKEDSVSFVLNRLQTGADIVKSLGFNITAFLPPHYLASPLDSILFGELFNWNVGRSNYELTKICGLKPLPPELQIDLGKINTNTNAKRLEDLSSLKISLGESYDLLDEQFFPYVIYGDYYNQRIIPETLSYIQPFLSNQVDTLRSIDDLLRDAKRNRVLRDVWASFYIHDIIINAKNNKGTGKFDGDTSEVERLIAGIKNLGYEFVDLKTWAPNHFKPKRPEPIEVYPMLGTC